MWFCEEGHVIDIRRQREMMARLVEEMRLRMGPSIKKALLVPPDRTRHHSGAGDLANMLYHLLEPDCRADVIPALGQHLPHTAEENRWMFGDIPQERIHIHDWKASCKTIGEISKDFVEYATNGRADWPIPIEINRALVEEEYDVVVSLGQVVPHEVLGFANHNKNLFIGLGGKSTIGASHIMAACCGGEDTLGQIITPLRGCFNVAERDYLKEVPIVYVLVVKTRDQADEWVLSGLYVGDDIETYVRAARYARANTVYVLDKPLHKVICFMDEKEFESTWVANKAIYRTRKVLADGGELVVIAPGVKRFGEQEEVDRLIREYGYRGTPHTLQAYKTDDAMRDLGHAAAHLIHGSSEGRFTITYAPGHLSREEVESVGFRYMDIERALRAYNPQRLKDGFNMVDGKETYFISSPGLGLWTSKEKLVASLKANRAFAERMIAGEPNEKIWRQMKQWDDEDIKKYESSATEAR
jgi:nickel-dependent lactate racemase